MIINKDNWRVLYLDDVSHFSMSDGGSFECDDSSISKVHVQYKFKNDEKEYRGWLTMAQFKNLQLIPIIEYCMIISE